MKINFKKIVKNLIGIVLIPIFLVLFYADRVLSIWIPIVTIYDIRTWFGNEKEMANSIVRFIVLGLLTLLIYTLVQIFN